MTKPKPKRTAEEQQFLDIAAIQIACALIRSIETTTRIDLGEVAYDAAEGLLGVRNRRL